MPEMTSEPRTDVGRNSVMTRARRLGRRARRLVQERPLQAIALTVGLGFVVGKILHGRED